MATLYNQYIYKDGAWRQVGVSSNSVTYTISSSGSTLTLVGSDGSTSTATVSDVETITNNDINQIVTYGVRSNS